MGRTSHAIEGFEDRTKEVKSHILSIAKLLRRRTQQSWEDLNVIIEQVATVTEDICNQANAVIEKTKDKGKQSVKTMKEQLDGAITLTRKLIDKAKQVVSGDRRIPDRIISFFDPEA